MWTDPDLFQYFRSNKRGQCGVDSTHIKGLHSSETQSCIIHTDFIVFLMFIRVSREEIETSLDRIVTATVDLLLEPKKNGLQDRPTQ